MLRRVTTTRYPKENKKTDEMSIHFGVSILSLYTHTKGRTDRLLSMNDVNLSSSCNIMIE